MSIKQVSVNEDDTVEFGQYLRVLRDHKRLLALGLVLGIVAGVVAAQLRAPTYTSNAQLVVQPVGLSGVESLNSDGNVNIATQQQLASSADVAERVRQNLDIEVSTSQLVGNLNVTVPARSSVLSFSFTALSAQDAQAGAQGFAQAYLDVRRDRGVDFINNQVSIAQGRVTDIQAAVEGARVTLASAAPNSEEAISAQVERDVLLSQLATLQTRIGELSSISIEPGKIIRPATLPPSDGRLTRILAIVSFALFGLLLGALAGFVQSRIDTRVRRADDVERNLNLPVFATLGGRKNKGGPSEEVVLQLLAAQLLVATRATPGGMVALATPIEGPSVTGMAIRLATAMAERGALVTVVVPEAPEVPGHDRVQVIDVAKMRRSTGGLGRSNAALDEARVTSAIVIVSTPGTLTSAESLMLAGEADAVALIAQPGVTRTDDLQHAAAALEGMGTTVIGVILDSPAEKDRRASSVQVAATDAEADSAKEPVRSR